MKDSESCRAVGSIEEGQSITDVVLYRLSFRNFIIMEKIPNQPKCCPKICV